MQNETIVDRVVARLKTQPLGDLITEEDLHDVVKQAIPKTFFQERTVGEGYNRETRPPMIVEIMRELLQKAAQEAVRVWLVEHAEVVTKHWATVIDEGLLKYVQTMQNEIATQQVKVVVQALLKSLNDERMRAGLPPIYL